MNGTTQSDDVSTDYESNLNVLADHYTTLNGAQTPLSSLQTGVHSNDQPELSTLIPAALVRSHSDDSSWENLAAVAPWDLTDYERLQHSRKSELDEFIAAETSFGLMQAVIERAATHRINNESGSETATKTPGQESATIGANVRGGLQ
jgi:hypothetical protein